MCVYVAITFITRLWLFNSSFRTFIHSFVHALLFIVTRYTIRSLPSGIYNSPDFFFQFYTDRFLLVSFLLRNFSSTIVHKLANCYYCCYTTNVRKSWKLFELPRLMHRDSRYRGPKQVSRCGTNLLRFSVRWTRSGRTRESRIRKRAMLAGHSVDLTKHRARRRARNAGVTNGVAFLHVSLPSNRELFRLVERERERETAVPSKFHGGRGIIHPLRARRRERRICWWAPLDLNSRNCD